MPLIASKSDKLQKKEIKERRNKIILKKKKRLSVMTLQGAIKKDQYCNRNIGKMNDWIAQ